MTTSSPPRVSEPTMAITSWRKSSRSSNGSAQCVEVGCVHDATNWRKSTRSNGSGGQNCVEAGTCACHGIAVRDSKLPTTGDFPVLTMSRTDWTTLLHTVSANA